MFPMGRQVGDLEEDVSLLPNMSPSNGGSAVAKEGTSKIMEDDFYPQRYLG